MSLKSGITMLIHNKEDIEFVTEFPCLLGWTPSNIHIGNCLKTVRRDFKRNFK